MLAEVKEAKLRFSREADGRRRGSNRRLSGLEIERHTPLCRRCVSLVPSWWMSEAKRDHAWRKNY